MDRETKLQGAFYLTIALVIWEVIYWLSYQTSLTLVIIGILIVQLLILSALRQGHGK